MPNNLELSFDYNLNELPAAANWLIKKMADHKIVCIDGLMGSGKTTLIKTVCKQLGVIGGVNSPSFSLVNEYLCADGKLIYHFDFYRINSLEEVYDIGYESYFDSGHLCIIEWPEKIAELLLMEPAIYFKIVEINSARTICIQA